MRFLKLIYLTVIAALLCRGCFVTCVFADTIILSDGNELKGVVVEDYEDRVLFSTVEGEKQIMRKNIRRIIYDLEEQNLTSLADFYQDRDMYREAYYYYEKALAVNPDYKKARDGLNRVGTYLRQTSRRMKLRHIQRRNEDKDWINGVREKEVRDAGKQIRENFGMVLQETGGVCEVSEVMLGSPAWKAGIKEGDILLAVRGRAVKYTPLNEVMQKLLMPGGMDIKVVVERSLMLTLNNMTSNGSLLGAVLGFSEMEGLVVEKVTDGGPADLAGIKKNDAVVAIQGESTRYMSLKNVEKIINSRRGDTLSLKIKRDIVMWKKFKTE